MKAARFELFSMTSFATIVLDDTEASEFHTQTHTHKHYETSDLVCKISQIPARTRKELH